MSSTELPKNGGGSGALNAVRLIAPVLLLAGVIALFVFTKGAGLNITPAAPIETVQFERTTLAPGRIELRLRNTSPQSITVAQLSINEAMWPFEISPDRVVPRLGGAVVTLEYPWVQGEAYEITLLSGNSIPFTTEVPVAATTAGISAVTLWSFTLIGLYVGILPVVLGMLWLPLLARLGARGTTFLMSATVGLLLYLGVDATSEGLELGAELGGPLQGTGIVAIGIIGTVLLLSAVSRRQVAAQDDGAGKRRSLATAIAIGIGLHNLGEGLAIGAAYAVGAAALGTFLVIGFIIQNITEGLGIVVPISRDRPSLRTLGGLALIGGGPAIAGAWIGGLLYSQPWSVFFLAIGAGAVFQVAYQIGREMIWKGTSGPTRSWEAFAGVLTGMAVLYLTGLAIK
ncbi:MAG: metal transporter [Gemmatimonadales bacterium]|jgi:ZIP family zinc transporter|nr:MAG: metal transporter [Gemmatimonadales bacterium]